MPRSRPSQLLGGVLVISASIALTEAAAAQDAALIKKGQDVYNAQKCAVCHSVGGKGSKANPLDGIGAKASADDIRAWITDPVAMTKKTGSQKKPPMPKNAKLTTADVDALVAYMQSLK
jgi:mono/diheme cytochrome c family protein